MIFGESAVVEFKLSFSFFPIFYLTTLLVESLVLLVAVLFNDNLLSLVLLKEL